MGHDHLAHAATSAKKGSWLERRFRYSSSEFCIYRNQPVVLLATKLWGGAIVPTFCAFLALFLVPKFIVAAVNGAVSGSFNVTSDLLELLGFSRRSASTGTVIPLLRDYADLAIAILMAAHTAHLVRQWHRVSRLPSLLRQNRLISPSTVGDAEFTRIVERNERRFNTPLLEVVALACGIAGGIGVAYALSGGIYPRLDGSIPNHEQLHYAGWWANREKHSGGFYLQVSMYSFYLYLMLRHALMGVVAVLFVKDFRDLSVQKGRSWIQYESPWHYASPAVRELRRAVRDIVISLVLGVAALIIGTAYVSFSSLVVLALIFFYSVYNPVLIAVPVSLINRELRASAEDWRARAHAQWHSAHETLQRGHGSAKDAREAELARVEYERACELPTSILEPGQLFRDLALYVVPVLLLTLALLKSP